MKIILINKFMIDFKDQLDQTLQTKQNTRQKNQYQMSRYYQSSYNGSTDYRKYRQEKMGKNDPLPRDNSSKPYQQSSTYRPESSKNILKENLQTFGKETCSKHDKQPQKATRQASSYKQFPKRTSVQSELRSQSPFLIQRQGLNVQAEQGSECNSRISKYMQQKFKDTVPTREQFSTKSTVSETASSSYVQRSSSRHREIEIRPQIPLLDNFQDSIISRRKNYGYLNKQVKEEISEPTRSYNYASRLGNVGRQSSELSNYKIGELGGGGYVEKEQVPVRKYDERPKSKYAVGPSNENSSPYQSRNDLIKQRLNNQRQTNEVDNSIRLDHTNTQSYRGQTEKRGQQLQRRGQQLSARYKNTQLTPSKSPLTPREERDASSNRRKSLIEKSQMLKEKLTKLNATSNTKPIDNQQNDTSQNSYKDKENINQQTNTYSKRYQSNTYQSNTENCDNLEKNVTKRLNFDQLPKDIDTQRTSDRCLKESNQNTTRNYSRNQNSLSSNNKFAEDTQKIPINEMSGQGALKKINELNNRINSRLQSILKNYG